MDPIDEPFEFLRVSVENRLTERSVIVVTSALADDGTGMVASGLAGAFARTGRRTLLVDATRGFAGSPGNARPGGTANLFDVAATSLSAVRDLGAEFPIVIVEALPVVDSAVAFELARGADGVLLAIRLGRRPVAEDRRMLKLLDEGDAKIIGVVPTGKDAASFVRPFRRLDPSADAANGGRLAQHAPAPNS